MSAGTDDIHSAIFKRLFGIIAGLVSKLFQASIDQDEISNEWRGAAVVAIHNGGPTSVIENFRVVSLSRILIRAHISQYIVLHSMFCLAQHGFTRDRSCFTNLLCFLEEVIWRMDEGTQVEVCCFDFTKAFDSVNHRQLLMKLELSVMRGKVYQWVKTFLPRGHFASG